MLWTLAVIFALYVAWDVLTIREQIARYDPALTGGSRATAAQIRSIYAGGFTGAAHVAPGPAITLVWSGFFVLLAIIGNGRAYAHIRTTCVLALIGLVGFWIDTAVRHDDGAGTHPMRRRILVILLTLIAATIYFRLRPGV
jgi:FtsH-binding integral membrane protein